LLGRAQSLPLGGLGPEVAEVAVWLDRLLDEVGRILRAGRGHPNVVAVRVGLVALGRFADNAGAQGGQVAMCIVIELPAEDEEPCRVVGDKRLVRPPGSHRISGQLRCRAGTQPRRSKP